jgi:hypothetical protein
MVKPDPLRSAAETGALQGLEVSLVPIKYLVLDLILPQHFVGPVN